MPAKDTTIIKEKIISIFQRRGPSLPVHISSEIGMSTLFASAFLSELISEKKLRTSYMRVGSSPLYLIPGQEPRIEEYSQHLKSKEKEAFLRIKENKFLDDAKQEPAIRVALRNIRDFAIPFKVEEKVIWRYHITPESEFAQEKKEIVQEPVQQILEIEKPQTIEPTILEKTKTKEKKKVKEKTKKPAKRKTPNKKQDEKFFNKVKEFLSKESIEILNIEGFGKTDVSFKIKKNGKEQFLVAYNKKRIAEADIIAASKKALELNLPYTILSFGEPAKKLDNLIEAIKNLDSMEKIKECVAT